MKSQKGFSLVELLVVVIIIAIIAAIAIPNLLASRRVANEAAAVSSLRTLHSAEATYQALNTPIYGALTDLGPAPAAGLIDGALAAGTKDNYTFAVTRSTNNALYCATATPSGTASGIKIFGVDSSGSISVSAADGTGAPACAAGVLTGGTALQ